MDHKAHHPVSVAKFIDISGIYCDNLVLEGNARHSIKDGGMVATLIMAEEYLVLHQAPFLGPEDPKSASVSGSPGDASETTASCSTSLRSGAGINGFLANAFLDSHADKKHWLLEDWENPQLYSDHVKDTYQYLRQLEVLQSISPRFLEGRDINGLMGAILVDWLVQVRSKFRLLQETLYRCVAVMGRFLQVQPVSGKKLRLVGITALLLASKYEEMFSPNIEEFGWLHRRQCLHQYPNPRKGDFHLERIEFRVGPSPVPAFLKADIKSQEVDVEQHT
ncbi:G2/mitotic-specific cyclin-B2 [Fukomys damarensis]|uniref:G2/mitotic-specific cyclin-B1 n=1 Tax=Fukomys damarensis TaxID=885580 RepID=A0A091CUC1_FUKDA|nr:G2/mitotic-specific cyclin-B2 [Fukomys damarensis]